MAGDTAVYNAAEFYALRVLQDCSDELSSGQPRSGAMLDTLHEVAERFGTTGLGCLVAALGRIGTTELAIRAARDSTTITALLEDWQQHKLEQQHAEKDE